MQAAGFAYQWFLALAPTWQIVVGVGVGLVAWFAIGMPFGIRAMWQSRKNFVKADTRSMKAAAYLGTFIIASCAGALGTGYLIIRFIVRRFRKR